jgi:hypothetical protein
MTTTENSTERLARIVHDGIAEYLRTLTGTTQAQVSEVDATPVYHFGPDRVRDAFRPTMSALASYTYGAEVEDEVLAVLHNDGLPIPTPHGHISTYSTPGNADVKAAAWHLSAALDAAARGEHDAAEQAAISGMQEVAK